MSPRELQIATEPDAERALLGVLLLGDQDAAWDACHGLDPRDLASERHRLIYTALLAARDAGDPCDLPSIVTALRHAGTLELAGHATYLASLRDQGGTARAIPTYVRTIRDAAHNRRLQALSADLAVALGHGNGAATGVLKRLRAELDATPTSTPKITPIDFSTDPEPVKWLVRSLIPVNGSTIIAAASNTGKSWMALDLALSVALGLDFLGQPDHAIAHNSGPVIVVEEESPPGAIHWRLAALMRGRGLALKESALHDRLYAYASQGVRPSNPTTWGALVSQVKRLHPCLVTLDPCSSMLDGPDTDPEYVAPFLKAVRELRHLGTAVLLVHHAGWNEPGRVRGWSGWRDAADTEVNLVSTTPNNPTLKWSKVRDGRRPDALDLHLRYDDDNHSMTLEIAGRHPPDRLSGQTLDLELWSFVRGRGGSRCDRHDLLTWGTQNELGRATVDRSIARLKDTGKLNYDGRSYEAVG